MAIYWIQGKECERSKAMKKILILMIVAAMLLTSAAMAKVPSEMKVVNCKEWVSLRAEPNSEAQRFAEVKLGETVRGFYASYGDFTQCEYEGAVGYILNDYLEVMGGVKEITRDASAEPTYSQPMEDGSLAVWKDYSDFGETMYLARLDASGNEIWHYATESLSSTELSMVDAFVNTPAGLVMVYNNDYGLIALDAATGMEKWTLPCSEVSLGGSITGAVGSDGSMYIGGYYGPDPVGISADGKVLFESESLYEGEYGPATFYWLHEISVQENGITARYENGDMPVKASFDFSGKMISWEKE